MAQLRADLADLIAAADAAGAAAAELRGLRPATLPPDALPGSRVAAAGLPAPVLDRCAALADSLGRWAASARYTAAGLAEAGQRAADRIAPP